MPSDTDLLTRADIPLQTREAALVPTTLDAAANTIEVTWTTGFRRRAYSWARDEVFEEELDVSPSAVDMARFESGTLQVIDSHDTYSGVSAILGIATSGKVVKGEGRATIALSQDPAKAGVVGDIKAGIIRAMSFGYSVQKYEVTPAKDRKDGSALPLYRATRWTPMELTFCAVGADPHAAPRAGEVAHTRSQPAQVNPCEFVVTRAAAQPPKETTMTEAELQAQRDQEAATRAAADQAHLTAAATSAARTAAVAEERTRVADITTLVARHAVPADKAAEFVAKGLSIEAVRTAILDDLATRSSASNRVNVHNTYTVRDESDTAMDGLRNAVLHRVDPRAKLDDNGRRFRGMSLIEMGRGWLEERGIDTRGMDRMKLAQHILHFRSGMYTTSDFASLFENVANKRLRGTYEENKPSYMMWARRAPNAPDFKAMSVVNLAGAPDLLKVNEHGEFTVGSMTDGKETYSMLTYGRIVPLTRQAIVNDDLRGFDSLVSRFGNSAARLENRIVYAILTANAALADTGNLFNATAVTTAGGHANLGSGGGSVLQASSLVTARTAMRLQKGLQSEELNVMPRHLIVPAALEQTAYQLTSPNYVPATTATINEFRQGGRTALEPIVEAILDANSATAWYLAADNNAIDTVEYCFLDGAEGPVIESEVGFEVDGISYKCREDFAAKAIDFRGLYKSAGA